MLKQIITPTLGVLLTVLPVQATVKDRQARSLLSNLAEQSSQVYCDSKDQGVSESNSLNNAFVYFLNGIVKETNVSKKEVIQLAEDDEFLEGYETLFNEAALRNCPEYY